MCWKRPGRNSDPNGDHVKNISSLLLMFWLAGCATTPAMSLLESEAGSAKATTEWKTLEWALHVVFQRHLLRETLQPAQMLNGAIDVALQHHPALIRTDHNEKIELVFEEQLLALSPPGDTNDLVVQMYGLGQFMSEIDKETDSLTMHKVLLNGALAEADPNTRIHLDKTKPQTEAIEERPPPSSFSQRDGYDILRLRSFAGGEHETALMTGLTGVIERGSKGMVIDLRGNEGGYLLGAVRFSERFVEEGSLVLRLTEDNDRFVAKSASTLWPDVPLVVMVDEKSAGGTEILAMALRRYRGAHITGTSTTGYHDIHNLISGSGITPGLKLQVLSDRWVGAEPGLEPMRPDTEIIWGEDALNQATQLLTPI